MLRITSKYNVLPNLWSSATTIWHLIILQSLHFLLSQILSLGPFLYVLITRIKICIVILYFAICHIITLMLLSSSNQKYICYITYCHLLNMHPGKTGNLFSLLLCSLWWVQRVGYVLACRLYWFVCTLHHLIIVIVQTLSEDIGLIKMPVRYNLSSVWIKLSIFSQLSIIQYVGLCVFSLAISFMMIERIFILCLIIIIKSEVWTITHCLGLGHETMGCTVCLSIFLLKTPHSLFPKHPQFTSKHSYIVWPNSIMCCQILHYIQLLIHCVCGKDCGQNIPVVAV